MFCLSLPNFPDYQFHFRAAFHHEVSRFKVPSPLFVCAPRQQLHPHPHKGSLHLGEDLAPSALARKVISDTAASQGIAHPAWSGEIWVKRKICALLYRVSFILVLTSISFSIQSHAFSPSSNRFSYTYSPQASTPIRTMPKHFQNPHYPQHLKTFVVSIHSSQRGCRYSSCLEHKSRHGSQSARRQASTQRKPRDAC